VLLWKSVIPCLDVDLKGHKKIKTYKFINKKEEKWQKNQFCGFDMD